MNRSRKPFNRDHEKVIIKGIPDSESGKPLIDDLRATANRNIKFSRDKG